MPSFSWAEMTTENFGKVKLPVAHIKITSSANVSRELIVVVDSGAVVTLLPRSIGTLLQLDIEAGRRVELKAVGGKKNAAFVHNVSLGFATMQGPGVQVPVAISMSENVPSLLGRIGVFDQFQIWHDPTTEETTFAGRWATKNQLLLFEELVEMDDDIVSRWRENPQNAPHVWAVQRLLTRSRELGAGVLALVQRHRSGATIPLLRAQFELSLQAEYLMQDPDKRAPQLLGFADITLWRFFENWSSDGAGELSAAVLFGVKPERVAEIRGAAKSAKGNYPKPTTNWYQLTVAELAKAVGREAEYRRWYSLWSAWSHGEPIDLGYSDLGARALVFVLFFHGRILESISRKTILTKEQSDVLERVRKLWT
ncbi:MAG: DUF5677 domain-containing protein [Phycisphaerae bacterium]